MDKDLVNDLIEFGFSDYEARVFLVLSMKGPLTASEISKSTRIPYSKVYEILNKLESKSILEISSNGKQKKYKVLDTQYIIKKIIEEKKENVDVLENKAENILKKIEKRTANQIEEGIWVSKGKKEFLEKVSLMLKNSNKYAYGITKEFSRIPDLDQEIVNASKRGVVVKLLNITNGLKTLDSARAEWYLSHNVKIKTLPLKIQPRVCLIDGKEVCMRVDNVSDSEFIWSNNPALINLIKSYFETLWDDAKTFRK